MMVEVKDQTSDELVLELLLLVDSADRWKRLVDLASPLHHQQQLKIKSD
jgi:hypothetical protein